MPLQTSVAAMMQARSRQRRHDRITDRWIDLIAASYGMPRIALLRELGTMPHLAGEIARMIAQQERAVPAATPVTTEQAPPRRTAQTDAATDDFLKQLRAEIHGEPPPEGFLTE